jgi:hypothetical protein
MKKYYGIDHKWLFLFGFIFYLLVPYFVGITTIFRGFPGMELYRGYFDKIPKDKIQVYVIISLSWLIAFYLGHFCFKLIQPKKTSLQLFPANSADYGIPAVGILLLFVLSVFTFLARNSVFGGYASYDIAARGKMSTLLVVFNFFLLYQLVSVKKVSWFLISGIVITCILLLSMGGRMYVFQTLIVVLIYKTSFAPKRWKIYQILLVATAGFFIGSISGIWRLGGTYNLARAGYSFLAEPVFTWISASTFLIANKIPLINFPSNFLTSFLNLIPNTVVSFKPYIVSSQGMGYSYLSPLGADSIWTTYIINFGVIGSFFFVFFTGFMLNFLRHLSEKNRFWAVYYILVCGMLPFQFFRDGFYIINKQLFFNFLFFPGVILIVLKLIRYYNIHQIVPLTKESHSFR